MAAAASSKTALLDVRVIPRSPRTRADGMRAGAILIRLSAPPVDGAANAALIEFLAGALGLHKRNIRIVSGEKSRDKRVAVTGIDTSEAVTRLLR